MYDIDEEKVFAKNVEYSYRSDNHIENRSIYWFANKLLQRISNHKKTHYETVTEKRQELMDIHNVFKIHRRDMQWCKYKRKNIGFSWCADAKRLDMFELEIKVNTIETFLIQFLLKKLD